MDDEYCLNWKDEEKNDRIKWRMAWESISDPYFLFV